MAPKEKHYGASRATKRAVAWTAGIGIFVVLAAIWVTAILLTNNQGADDTALEPDTDSPVEAVQRSLTGNTADEDRIATVERVTALLNDAQLDSDEAFVELMQALDEDGLNAEGLPEEILDYFRFEDSFADDPTRQVHAVQTVLTLSQVSSQFVGEGEDIAPIQDDAWSMVHLDSEIGVAYVPVQVFTGTPSGYSFTMVYVDETWQLDPYPLLDAVTTAALVQQNADAPVLEGVEPPPSEESAE